MLPQGWAQPMLLLAAELPIQDCPPEIPSPGNLDPGHTQPSAGPVMPNHGPFLVSLSGPIHSWPSFFTFAATCPATHLSTPQLPIRRGREPNLVPQEAVGEEQGLGKDEPSCSVHWWSGSPIPASRARSSVGPLRGLGWWGVGALEVSGKSSRTSDDHSLGLGSC